MTLNYRDTEPPGPPLVSILRQGSYLIASIHTALNDSELTRFQHDLIAQVGRYRARGVIIDVAALDVLDSFAAHTLRTIARTAALRGANTVIVGINPEVAFTMVQLGMRLESVHTALDLDEGLLQLDALTAPAGRRPAAGPTSTRRPNFR
jgi:rsbT antagonist protein RsbS